MSPFSFCIALLIMLSFPLSLISACRNDERKYLLEFRGALTDSSGRLDSWQQFNCCQWQGVICDRHSDHVVSLYLKNRDYYKEKCSERVDFCFLTGKIDPSLFKLHHLQYLDLSFNNFSGTAIPPQLENFKKLTFLNLANAEFEGEIPVELGNITTLRHLDLSNNYGLQSRRFAGWITSLRSLEYLAMNDVVNIPNEMWGDAISSLPNLREIDLSGCELSGTIPSLLNLTHLSHLDLSWNSFNSPLPAWFQNVSSLVSLHLHSCGLNGSIPSNFLYRSSLKELVLFDNNLEGIIHWSIANFSMLKRLALSRNQLSGTIPLRIGNLSSLTYLDLSRNQLSGTIPLTISKLFGLETLSVSHNYLNGSISLSVIENLAHLKSVDFSKNQLTVYISPSFIPQFSHLNYLLLGSCNLQGEIPPFLSTLYSLYYLDLSNNKIVGKIPDWLWNMYSLEWLDLSDNRLEGSLPPFISEGYMFYLDLHNNSLHDSVPDFSSLGLEYLDLSGNGFNGCIPKSLARCSFLTFLNLAQNHLEGEMPEELGNLTQLHSLNLNENKLQGIVPPTVASCEWLEVFDIGKNKLQGSIPDWIGEWGELIVLNLAYNNFQGTFPPKLLQLKKLQILHLSHNNLSGAIPQSLGKLNTMKNSTQDGKTVVNLNGLYEDTLWIGPMYPLTLWVKGHYTQYTDIIPTFKFMDLSYNKLSGSIPDEMGELKGLIALNVSNNNLRGNIPKSLGGMVQLESLDLSRNRLSGMIPTDLINLTFLVVLNVSYNQLSGIIPSGKQFATFEASSYVGNPNLHGWPLENGALKCEPKESGSQVQSKSKGDMERGADEMDRWWAVSVGLSFGVGFGSVIAVLCFNLEWRYKCFSLQDSIIQYFFEH